VLSQQTVWFAPLTSVRKSALVPAAVAETLGVRESSLAALEKDIASKLRNKHLMLVLKLGWLMHTPKPIMMKHGRSSQ
jgi:DNA-binding XRE family transcriptional regulator